MNPTAGRRLVAWLRAAGEPSRLRLLWLCSQRELSVSDLAGALHQSEPRVSRHLRILSEAGLLDRFRDSQWVRYRLTAEPAAAAFVQGLLAQLDPNEAELRRDLERTRDRGRGAAPNGATGGSRLGRALSGFMAAHAAGGPLSSVLVIGVEHLELLELAASISAKCTALAHSRPAARSARSFCERTGLRCRIETEIARAAGPFDAVVLDHPSASASEFATLLVSARDALGASGHLWLFERYESLELPREKVVEHPLARLRRLLGELQLRCEWLSPIEADGEHVLAAVAVPVSKSELSARRHA